MAEKLSRQELIELVQSIISLHDRNGHELTEAEHHELVIKFKRGVQHPGGTDLLYYPELVGLPANATVDEIVDLAMKEISPEK